MFEVMPAPGIKDGRVSVLAVVFLQQFLSQPFIPFRPLFPVYLPICDLGRLRHTPQLRFPSIHERLTVPVDHRCPVNIKSPVMEYITVIALGIYELLIK